MISLSTLYRHLQFQTVLVLVFGWRGTVFADEFAEYCTCLTEGNTPAQCRNEYLMDTPPLLIPNCGVHLLQPLDDATKFIKSPNGEPFKAFQQYFDISWPWVIGSAAGIAVLWAIVGGIEIMISGSDTTRRETGKGRFLGALAGLLLIGLSGMVLEILNPVFFKQ